MEKKKIKALLGMPLADLVSGADKLRREYIGDNLELCSITNAKSGLCHEDCKFCAQASSHCTDTPRYPLRSKEEIVSAAKNAKAIGARRFGIVTSGNRISKDELKKICQAVRIITQQVGIRACASLGSLKEDEFKLLEEAGLTRYHHNIETSPRYFPRIVTTHTFKDRITTIKMAKAIGLEVCSGGIIGMGETWEDRIEMALCLKELGVDSVPINVLIPIKGTPLDSLKVLSSVDAIKTIAIFRVILKDKTIKIAAGRETALKDFQALAFMAGANSMLVGGYLTVKGRGIDEDRKLAAEIKQLWKE